MKMTVKETDDELLVISLEGRLDLEGTQEIDQKFSFQATTQARRIVVDLSAVTFLASIGIRTLLSAARGQSNRGGKLVLAGPAVMVRQTLETMGIDKVVPIFNDFDSARASLTAA